ncbi:acetyltransferase [Actinoplanes hulinensis]|uniref:Lysine N-acyltransferase MbtK n=1 Tax=Actinoplanes hulinensis TaxID=1144547 RepID=A0ABS7B8B4_9ACTN|nr:GNAT family N-acetyltransferase [Actinoplanes hulinensis]MBW6436924.1 acetyltransferase [Actinoplanes hulinensis]
MSAETWSAESFRELTDGLDPAVVAAGPPPVPDLAGPWRVRVADPDAGDGKVVADWMALPHVDLFWEQNWPVERWDAVLRRQLAGACTLPLIAARDGADLAYLEVYRTPRDVVGRYYPAEPYDLGVHIAVGPLEATDRGLGRELMAALVDGLFAADPRCPRVVADPDARHAMARRMFAAAGFEPLTEVDLGHKCAALMSHPRPALRA